MSARRSSRGRGARWIGLGLAGIALVLLLLLGAGWWWAGTQASLDWALRRFAAPAGLQLQGATGSLRGGLQASQLAWEQDGLKVQATAVDIAWDPLALIGQLVSIEQLQAGTVQVVDQRPEDPQAAQPPQPQALRLPMAVAIEEFSVGELRWQAARPVDVRKLAGSYRYLDAEHHLVLRNLELDQGSFTGEARLGTSEQLPLVAELKGELRAPVPGSEEALPLRLEASAEGPLTRFAAKASLRALPAANAAAEGSLAATVTAVVTPWQEVPIAQASAQVRNLDLSRLWPEAPATALQGTLQAAPTGPQGWTVSADLANALPGPWDRQRLPFSQLTATAEWQPGGAVVVPQFRAQLGGGTAEGQGRWEAGQGWRVQAQVRGVMPSRIYTELGPEPLTGKVTASGQGEDFEFEVDLQAPAGKQGRAAPRAPAPTGPVRLAAWGTDIRGGFVLTQAAAPTQGAQPQPSPPPPPAAQQEQQPEQQEAEEPSGQQEWSDLLRALNLRQLIGKARYSKGVLTLPDIDVRTNDARLRGTLRVNPKERSAQGRLTIQAPGLDATFDGSLAARSGGGTLTADISQLAQARQWLQTLPAVPKDLIPALQGQADVDLQWQGGWQNPTVQARVVAPQLTIPPAAGEPGGEPLDLRNLTLTVEGDLDDARIALETSVVADALRAQVDLRGNLARTDAAWVLRLQALQLAASGLGATEGEWRLRLQEPVTVRYAPDGAIEVGAGQAVVTAPVTEGRSQAQLAWQATRWREGRLDSTGRFSSLPLAWLQLFTGNELLGPTVDQDLEFSGQWQLDTGENLQLQASVQHTGGDLTFLTENAQGEPVRVPAGIRQLRITVDNEGQQIEVSANLETERAGDLQAQATTRLVPGGPLGWQLPPEPPLQTTGRATGLSLSLLELLAGRDLLGPQIAGDLQFQAEWQARLGRELAIDAVIERTGGDLTVLAETAGDQTVRVPAGIQQARIAITNQGQQVQLDVDFQSERAGSLQGQVTTRLEPGGALGWQLPPSAPLGGQLQARLPQLRAWSALAPPGWRVRGSLQADLQVAGTVAEPRLDGLITADDLAVRSAVEGIVLQDGQLRARLEGQRLVIEELLFRGAGDQPGTLRATGVAELGPEGPQLRLDARLDELRASVRADRLLTVSGDARAVVDEGGVEITGDLRVDRALIVLPEETTPQLGDDVVVYNLPPGVQLRAETQQEGEGGLPLRTDIAIDLGQDFRVRGRGIDAGLRGALQVTGSDLSDPQVRGEVRIVDGEFAAYGQQLEIERGILRFTGPATNPALDILAVRPRLAETVGVQVTGRAQAPDIRLYSASAMTEAEKLSWLILGRGSAGGGAEAALVQRAALALLTNRTGAPGEGRGIAGVLGLDELSVGRGDAGDGAAVTLGKRLGDNLYASYQRSLSGALGTLYIFYDLTRNITLRAETGNRTSVDVIYRFSYD